MKFINNLSFFIIILFAFSLFLSISGQNVISIILTLLFLISIISKKNRNSFKNYIDNKIFISLLIFVFTPYIVSLFNGGINSRLDMDDYIKFLFFLPLVLFINEDRKFWTFLKYLLLSTVISLLGALSIFTRDFSNWVNPQGFHYPRISFALAPQDFANIMSITLLFLLSFFLFYRHEDKSENLRIKIIFSLIIFLNIFILLVNRSKMIYICLFPTILYLLYKKNKISILGFIACCFGGYFILPTSITDRLKYIIYFKKDPSSNLRLMFWETALEAIKKKPLLGMTSQERFDFTTNFYKQKNYYDYIAVNYGTKFRNILDTHNMYLQYLTYFGIGFLSLIYFFFIIIPSRLIKINFLKNNYKDSKFIALEMALKTSFIAYLIQGITEININNKTMILMFSVLLFLINYTYKKYNDEFTISKI